MNTPGTVIRVACEKGLTLVVRLPIEADENTTLVGTIQDVSGRRSLALDGEGVEFGNGTVVRVESGRILIRVGQLFGW